VEVAAGRHFVASGVTVGLLDFSSGVDERKVRACPWPDHVGSRVHVCLGSVSCTLVIGETERTLRPGQFLTTRGDAHATRIVATGPTRILRMATVEPVGGTEPKAEVEGTLTHHDRDLIHQLVDTHFQGAKRPARADDELRDRLAEWAKTFALPETAILTATAPTGSAPLVREVDRALGRLHKKPDVMDIAGRLALSRRSTARTISATFGTLGFSALSWRETLADMRVYAATMLLSRGDPEPTVVQATGYGSASALRTAVKLRSESRDR
jgi:hypothetical protein